MIDRKKGTSDRDLISTALKSMCMSESNPQEIDLLHKQSKILVSQNKRLTDTVLKLTDSVVNLTHQATNVSPKSVNELCKTQDNYDKRLDKLKIDILKKVLGPNRYAFFQQKTNMLYIFNDLILDFEDYNEPKGIKFLRGTEFEFRVAHELRKEKIKYKTEEKCESKLGITSVDFIATITGGQKFRVVTNDMSDKSVQFPNCTLAVECKSGSLHSVIRQASIVRDSYKNFILMIPDGFIIPKQIYKLLRDNHIVITRAQTSNLFIAHLTKCFVGQIKEEFKKATT